MSVSKVKNAENIIEFPNMRRNNVETTAALKLLLQMAEDGILHGIAGVTFETHEVTSCFAVGEACNDVSDTVYELSKLTARLLNS